MSAIDRDRLFLAVPGLECFAGCVVAALLILMAGLIWLL